VLGIRLLPVDLEEPSDCKGLCLRTYLVPTTAEKKEQTFSNLGAVGQKDLSSHVPRLRDL